MNSTTAIQQPCLHAAAVSSKKSTMESEQFLSNSWVYWNRKFSDLLSYPCVICTDPILFGAEPEYSMWYVCLRSSLHPERRPKLTNFWERNCESCRNVYHFRCVKAYCDYCRNNNRRRRSGNNHSVWRCPSCNAEQVALTIPTCWCGKQSHSFLQADSENNCNNACGKTGQCPHGVAKTCERLCHPGPCRYTCERGCQAPPTAPDNQWRAALQKPLSAYLCYWFLAALLYVLIMLKIGSYINHETHPYIYSARRTYSTLGEVRLVLEVFFWVILGSLAIFLLGALLVKIWSQTSKYLIKLDASGPNMKATCGIFLFVLLAGIWVLPILG